MLRKIQSTEEPLNLSSHHPGRNAVAQWDGHVSGETSYI